MGGAARSGPESGNVVDLASGGIPMRFAIQCHHMKPGSYDFSFDLVGSQRGITTTTDVFVARLFLALICTANFFTLGNSDKTVTNALLTVGTRSRSPSISF